MLGIRCERVLALMVVGVGSTNGQCNAFVSLSGCRILVWEVLRNSKNKARQGNMQDNKTYGDRYF